MSSSAEPPTRHLTAFHLEAVRLGAASPAERAWVDGHLPGCPSCARLAASLEAARSEFSAEVLPRTAPRVRARAVRGQRLRLRWLPLVVAVPAVAALVLLLRPRPRAGEDIAVKGSPALVIAARRGERVFRPRVGDPVRPGDRIRFVLEDVRLPFVLIASVDGAGHASVYHPYGGSASAPLGRQPRVEVEGSVVLDASPGPERVFAFFSRAPLEADAVKAALASVGAGGAAAIRRTSRLEVGAAAQSSVLLEKVTE